MFASELALEVLQQRDVLLLLLRGVLASLKRGRGVEADEDEGEVDRLVEKELEGSTAGLGSLRPLFRCGGLEPWRRSRLLRGIRLLTRPLSMRWLHGREPIRRAAGSAVLLLEG